MNPEVQCRIHKGSPIIPILSRINPIPRIDTYLFKVHFNIVLPSTPRPPQRSLFMNKFTLYPNSCFANATLFLMPVVHLLLSLVIKCLYFQSSKTDQLFNCLYFSTPPLHHRRSLLKLYLCSFWSPSSNLLQSFINSWKVFHFSYSIFTFYSSWNIYPPPMF